MPFVGERGATEMVPYFEELGPDGVRDFWSKKNRRSLDDQPTGLFPEDP